MKVTTQRTNKFAKILVLLGQLGIVAFIFMLIAQSDYSFLVLAGSVILYVTGRVSAWWCNE